VNWYIGQMEIGKLGIGEMGIGKIRIDEWELVKRGGTVRQFSSMDRICGRPRPTVSKQKRIKIENVQDSTSQKIFVVPWW